MIQASLELYLDGQWKEFHLYNQLVFDERKDGQLASGMCYIRTKEKVRFKPMRKARLNLIEDDVVKKQYYYFAYFKSQKTDLEYWMHEVTLIDPAKRVQGEMINGLRVVQNESNSISLYDTFVRLCNTTPLRLTTQENVYNPAVDGLIIPLMKKIRSPEYAWSCRTLFWECLKEIGMDMGGYFPTVSFGENGKYVISFIPTENIVKTVTDFPYFSYAEGEDINQVCSEIDTDISNVIATNQGTASVVFPSQNGWITPRTDDVRLTTDNCEIILPIIPEKILHIYLNADTVKIRGLAPGETGATQIHKLSEIIKTDKIDLIEFIPEFKKYSSLSTINGATYDSNSIELCKNNACYWTENTNKITIVSEGGLFKNNAYESAIKSAVLKQYGGDGVSSYIYVNGEQAQIEIIYNSKEIRDYQFRVEYVSRDTSTKIRVVKQEICNYEYVQPFNQRAEIVDATSLGKEMNKTVNQMGVPYIKAAWRYKSLSDILPIGTAFVKDSETYILTINECELTSHDNILVTHTFSKNWSMISSYLKQNKQYRNTKIPTDILVRNLHYQDYFVIAEHEIKGEKGLLSGIGIGYAGRVFGNRVEGQSTEVNNMWLYRIDNTLKYKAGVVLTVNSFGVNKSIVFSSKTQNNLSAGKQVDPDNEYYCKEVLYTEDNGEFSAGKMQIKFGAGMEPLNVEPNKLPESSIPYVNTVSYANTVLTGEFYVDKSSAEQINMTYQIHFVSDMNDIVIGALIAENNPLVVDYSTDLKYQLWGLKKTLPKSSIVVNEIYGQKLADITSANKSLYWSVFGNEEKFSLDLSLKGKMSEDYIGWAITDEFGQLYLARNGKPNLDQELVFNHLHKFHEQN